MHPARFTLSRNPSRTRPRIAASLTLSLICLLPHAAAASQKTPAEQRLQELLQRARSTMLLDDQKALAFEIVSAIDEAVAANDFVPATRMAALGVEVATKSQNNHALLLAKSRKDQAAFANREYRKVARQFEQLASDPLDPSANLAAGKFTCLVKREWAAGLPLLRRGDDPAWSEPATVELANPTPAGVQLVLGDKWMELAATVEGPLKDALHHHAYDWYQRVFKESSLQRETAAARMQELPIRYLTDLPEANVKQGPWPLGKYGKIGIDRPMEINGQKFPNGLGLHPPDRNVASVTYNLGGNYKMFGTGVGISDHSAGFKQTVIFTVLGDGRLLWRSRPFKALGDVEYCQVSVKDVRTLELRTESPGVAVGGHAVWLDPLLSK